MRSFITIVGAVFLVLSSVTASDARLNAKRQAPPQIQGNYYDQPTYNDQERRGGDCPIYHCDVNVGG